MKIAGICFTKNGRNLAEKIDTYFQNLSEEIDLNTSWYVKGRHFEHEKESIFHYLEDPVQKWTQERFQDSDALIFVGAAGIAVRAIAPWVRDKRTDPAVIVLDERGKFCISLLSGHIGGANAMVKNLSEKIGSIPVITTATDINHQFAVDVYATENQMTISSMTYAKEVSAALLSGEPVGFYTNFEVDGNLPDGIVWSDKLQQARQDKGEDEENGTSLGIYISPSYSRAYFDHTLWLIPRCLIVGIGCKKGTPEEKIEALVNDTLREYSLYPEALMQAATIDLKKDEPGLREYCEKYGLPLHTYSAEELNQTEGHFTASAFVLKAAGVDNVCERSAVRDGGDVLLTQKKAKDGVTVAIALKYRRIKF